MTEQPPAGFDHAIADYYERAPEESRLEHGASQLEQARTRELIERHAPPAPAEVLDVGGAAGAYALWLAERGYAVHLLDAAPRLVDEARRRAERAARGLASCRVADARALPANDESVALVLLLGPLYHLVDAADRRRALREASRVLRPGGVLIAAGISRWASALDGLARNLLVDARFARIVERDILDGQHRNPTDRLDYFTTAYFHRPDELRDEVEGAGLTVEGPYGIEGPGWILPDLAERWNDPERRASLLHIARALEAEPAVLGCSAHLLVVGRKQPAATQAA
jgi:SAM-dependent methyltransferase